jgi:hypothetical protein
LQRPIPSHKPKMNNSGLMYISTVKFWQLLHHKFSNQPIAILCFHCLKLCELWVSDDDKENNASSMWSRVVWYKFTKTCIKWRSYLQSV